MVLPSRVHVHVVAVGIRNLFLSAILAEKRTPFRGIEHHLQGYMHSLMVGRANFTTLGEVDNSLPANDILGTIDLNSNVRRIAVLGTRPCCLFASQLHVVMQANLDVQAVRHREGNMIAVVPDVLCVREGQHDLMLELRRTAGNLTLCFANA